MGFGESLASHHAIRGGLLVPLLLFECRIPLRLDFRVRLDCRDPRNRGSEIGRLRELLQAPVPPKQEIPCPYPGMRAYSAENAALFGGRDHEIDDLVQRLSAGLRELYVIGPSGSGKSSLLQSGPSVPLGTLGDVCARGDGVSSAPLPIARSLHLELLERAADEGEDEGD